jgi:hypothetical protein
MRHLRIKPAGWLALAFLASFVILLWMARGQKSPMPVFHRPLRVGIVEWPGYAGGVYANSGLKHRKGSIFWRECGLLVDFVLMPNGKKDREQALSASNGHPNPAQLDVVWSTVDYAAEELPRLRREKGIDARIFLQVDWSRGGDAIVSTPEIGSIRDLKGKIVALDWYGPSGWLLSSALRAEGLTKDDVHIIDTKSPKKAGKLFEEDETVAAAVLWEPYVTQSIAGKRRGKILLSTSSAANLIADVLVAREDFIQTHRNALVAFCNCWLMGAEDVNQNPYRAVKPLLDVFQNVPDPPAASEKDTSKMLQLVAPVDRADNVEMFGLYRGNQHPTFDSIFVEARNLMSKYLDFTPEEAKDMSILESLISPQPPSLNCGGTEPFAENPVIRKQIVLDFGLSRNLSGAQKARLEDLGSTAQIYSHGCVSLAGPHAEEVKGYLTDHYRIDEKRFVITPDGNRGIVYVLPDDEVKRRTLTDRRRAADAASSQNQVLRAQK